MKSISGAYQFSAVPCSLCSIRLGLRGGTSQRASNDHFLLLRRVQCSSSPSIRSFSLCADVQSCAIRCGIARGVKLKRGQMGSIGDTRRPGLLRQMIFRRLGMDLHEDHTPASAKTFIERAPLLVSSHVPVPIFENLYLMRSSRMWRGSAHEMFGQRQASKSYRYDGKIMSRKSGTCHFRLTSLVERNSIRCNGRCMEGMSPTE